MKSGGEIKACLCKSGVRATLPNIEFEGKRDFHTSSDFLQTGFYFANTGFTFSTKKVGEEITLVYEKSGRYATIYLAPKGTLGGFIAGDYGSDIDISVVHPDAIGIQNPYDELNYDSLPESP